MLFLDDLKKFLNFLWCWFFVFLDPLGALWPTIGILIEAVLLFLIIALYSCCKKSRNQSSTDKGTVTYINVQIEYFTAFV